MRGPKTMTFKNILLISFVFLGIMMVFPDHVAFAQEAATTVENSSETAGPAIESPFLNDLKQARDVLTQDTTNRPFLRGLLMPLFQPVFMLIMFCFGLWTGQQSDKLSTIWAVPIILLVGVVASAFITAFHPEWQPDLTFADNQFIPDMTANGVTGVVLSILVGFVVGMQITFPAYFAIAFASIAGLGLGFTHTVEESTGAGSGELVSFWLGFGLSGLIFNIIGIGFETFLESINLSVMVRLVGFICVGLGFVLAVNVF